MSQANRKSAPGGLSVRICYDDHRQESVVIRSLGERVWLDGDEFEKMQIVEPAGLEAEPLFHRVGRPYDAILSVAFQALSERH
jgi:hypothetical protein